MASIETIRRFLLVILIVCTVIFSCASEEDDYEPQIGAIGEHHSHEGDEDHGHEGGGEYEGHEGRAEDGSHDGGLLCFHGKHIYSGCEESCRLSEHGDIHVEHDQVDEFCNGPCFEETNHVLECLDGIMDRFLFYNQATTQDIRHTILAGCGHGEHRGDFDVGEHIEDDEGSANIIGSDPKFSLLFFLVITIVCHILVF